MRVVNSGTNLGRSWTGAYIVHTGQYDVESIHYESQVDELTQLSPRVARRHKTPVGEAVRYQRL